MKHAVKPGFCEMQNLKKKLLLEVSKPDDKSPVSKVYPDSIGPATLGLRIFIKPKIRKSRNSVVKEWDSDFRQIVDVIAENFLLKTFEILDSLPTTW